MKRETLTRHLVDQHGVRARITADMGVDDLIAVHRNAHDDPDTYHEVEGPEELRHIRLTQSEYDSLFSEREGYLQGEVQVDYRVPEWANYALVISYADDEVRVVYRVEMAEVTSYILAEHERGVVASARIYVKRGAKSREGK